MNSILLDVRGMSCPGCEKTVEAALESVPGIIRAKADFRGASASVESDGTVSAETLTTALEQSGYAGVVRTLSTSDGVQVRGGSRFDLAVLGGGSAGFAAAIRATELGARVALLNAGTIGGTCVNVGCVPSKTLIRAAEANHRRSHHGFAGVSATDGRIDWSSVRDQKDALVRELRQEKYIDVLGAYPDITLFAQRGQLDDEGRVRLADGSHIEAGRIVVTTGSSPTIPPVPGLVEAGFLDSASAMELERFPRSLVVIGVGVVGLELGQAFARLGATVTLLSRRDGLLPGEDDEIRRALLGYLRDDGLTIRTRVTVERIERNGPERRVWLRDEDGRLDAVSGEQILVAAGRRPNTSGFGLDQAGVKLGERGEIRVNDYMRTSNPAIYAAGDVTGEPMHVYVAARAGALAAENALRAQQTPLDLRVLPRVTFTDPAVASVGLTEAAAREQQFEPITAVLPMTHVPRALAARDTRGLIKLVADAATRRILGAHILAPEAGELIMEPALAIRFGLTIDDLTSTLHPYLTLAEGIRLAAQTFDRDVATLPCCAA
ncbi:MAG: mercury(II) reductase [Gemmatimonadetes bacterium]|nr:mercury(II) reductase [Gemmatimonadota bacterium]